LKDFAFFDEEKAIAGGLEAAAFLAGRGGAVVGRGLGIVGATGPAFGTMGVAGGRGFAAAAEGGFGFVAVIDVVVVIAGR